jgi:hypothetical protein
MSKYFLIKTTIEFICLQIFRKNKFLGNQQMNE